MKKTALLAAGMLILATVGWLAAAPRPHSTPPRDPGIVAAAPGSSPAASPVSTSAGTAVVDVPAAASGAAPGVLPVTADADAFAAAVAGVVFGMDTRELDPADYRDLLLDHADPHLTPTGRADLERLLAERIPTPEQWARMRTNDQWSSAATTQVWEPGSWTQVVIAGDAQAGWVVRNVTVVETTRYTSDGAGREAVRERSVTIAMRCPAPGAGVDSCRLVLVGASVLP